MKGDPAAWCDLFMHTWDTLHVPHPTWHNRGRAYRDLASNRSSAACVARIKQELRPAVLVVGNQSSSTALDYASDQGTWFCPPWDRDCPSRADSGVAYAGLRASTRAAVAVASAREVFEAAHQRAYDVAVRARPDTYRLG
jgi:hypothetical protein